MKKKKKKMNYYLQKFNQNLKNKFHINEDKQSMQFKNLKHQIILIKKIVKTYKIKIKVMIKILSQKQV